MSWLGRKIYENRFPFISVLICMILSVLCWLFVIFPGIEKHKDAMMVKYGLTDEPLEFDWKNAHPVTKMFGKWWFLVPFGLVWLIVTGFMFWVAENMDRLPDVDFKTQPWVVRQLSHIVVGIVYLGQFGMWVMNIPTFIILFLGKNRRRILRNIWMGFLMIITCSILFPLILFFLPLSLFMELSIKMGWCKHEKAAR